jgi:hypothetical protein
VWQWRGEIGIIVMGGLEACGSKGTTEYREALLDAGRNMTMSLGSSRGPCPLLCALTGCIEDYWKQIAADV